MTLTPIQKKIAIGLGIAILLFLVWHFAIRKSKAVDGKTSLLDRIKAKEKELQDCILKGGANCKGIKDDLAALVKKAPAEVKAEVKADVKTVAAAEAASSPAAATA